MSSSSFDARFGAVLRSAGIAATPIPLYQYQGELGLSPQEVWLIGALLAHRWDIRDPYPSIHRLAKWSGVSRPSIHHLLNRLRDRGLIEVTNRYGDNGRQISSAYSLEKLFDRLTALVIRDAEAAYEQDNDRQGGGSTGGPGGSTGFTQSRSMELDPEKKSSSAREDFPAFRRNAAIVVARFKLRGNYDWLAQKLAEWAGEHRVAVAEVERLVRRAVKSVRDDQTIDDFWGALELLTEEER